MVSNNQSIIYSIVIPHYNLTKGLKRCLDSIPRRPDVEVIVVDDVSSADEVQSLRHIEKQYDNVRFIYSKTKGYGGRARNIGMEAARGKYILFSDADDFFTKELNEIFDDYVNSEVDIVFFRVNKLNEETLSPTEVTHHLNDYIDLWDTDREKAELYLRYMFGEPWCKLVKREIITRNHVRFDEVRINNDTTFSYMVGYYSKTIGKDDRVLYNYLVRVGSTSRQRDIGRLFIKIDVFGRSELFFKAHNIPLHEDRQYLSLGRFVKKRDSAGFRKGFKQLLELGYTLHGTRKEYSEAMSRCRMLVPIWNVLFVPDIKIKGYCLLYWFTKSLPRAFKRVFLRRTDGELRRY